MITLYDHLDKFLEDEKDRIQHTIPLNHLVSELMDDLGYLDDTDLNTALLRAFEVCCTLQISIPTHFKKIYRFSDNRLQIDWQVSDLACYLLLINGNSCNPNVARAQLRAIVFTKSR
ncbi:MAG: hypothetical protein ABIN89_14935 [Chitinophagaceae bacterium]